MSNSSANNASDTVLMCEGLSKTFTEGPAEVNVLKDITLNINNGEQAGNDMATLDETRRGKLRNENLGFVYQFHHLLREFSALENVAMPLLIRGLNVNEATQRSTSMLERVGLEHRLQHKPSELSGGERQRAALARALVTHPACVLADEPTGNLDGKTAEQVYGLMREVNRELNTSFVVVTHDMNYANNMDRILHLVDGQIKN